MQGDSGKRRPCSRPLRKRSKATPEKVIELFDRCEDTESTTQWGAWRLDFKRSVLLGKRGEGYPLNSEYEIPLMLCRTSAQKCDWLAQVAEKSWATREVLGGLVQAFDATMGLRPGEGER